MAGVKGRSGGRRDGAGRKPKSHLYPIPVAEADDYIAPSLRAYMELLDSLARGQIESVRERWMPSALVQVERVDIQETERGSLVPVKSKVPAFPNLRPTDMVLVEKRIESGMPDFRALTYLINRIMGRPAGQPDSLETDEATELYDLSKLSSEEMDALSALLRKASLAAAADNGRGESGSSATLAG